MTIKEFRQSQGLSQPKLAKALGIGVSTVGGYETGKIKPSAKVIAKIREVFGVDLGAATSAAVEAAPAKKASKAKKAATVAVEEKKEAAPAKKTSKAKKEEAAPAPAKKTSKTKKAATVAVEEKKEAAPAKKTSKTKKEEAAPTPAKTSKPKKTVSSKQTAIVIQSPMGGEITTEDILAKVGDVDTVYVRVDQNAIYWIKGEKSGAVNIW